MSERIEYTKKVMKHFTHPKNMGEIKNPDGIGKVGNLSCGDVMHMYIKVKKRNVKGKNEEYIKDIKFKTLGCAAAIATSSATTEIAKGMSLEKAERLTRDEVADKLGGLPPIKMHCSNLASDALRDAIKDYRRKKHEK